MVAALWSGGQAPQRLASYGAAPGALVVAPVGGPVIAAGRTAGATSVTAGSDTDWLDEINVYREAAGESAVADQSAWDAGIVDHLTYLADTPESYFTGQYASLHSENPASPYYTAAGAEEGESSDLILGAVGFTPVQLIDLWLTAPFHAVGMLRSQLTEVAFAYDPTTGDAGLDILRGLDYDLPAATGPVLFPGPWMTTDLTDFIGGESPDPLQTCGWAPPTGLPLIALLPQSPAPGLSAQLTGPDGTQTSAAGNLCVVDDNTYYSSDPVYGPTGLEILQQDNAVFLIPNSALAAGSYQATINQPGQPVITWSFMVGPSGPTLGPSNPTNVSAASTASGEATVSWTAPASAVAEGVTGYTVTTYNDLGEPVGSPQPVSGALSPCEATVTSLTDGTPWYFSVAAVNAAGETGPAAQSNSVTPLSGSAPGTAETAVSTKQYHLPNSDGSTWQVMDESSLAFTMTPSVTENVLLSANSDLWTQDAGYNQDLGILVTPSGGSSVLAAWKESGGFAGTYSPNAAFVETVYAMAGGTTYTVQVVWKTNKAAIGKTIAAGAGAGPIFSPTRLTADVLPAGAQTAVSTQQYTLPNSNGSSWSAMDATNLKVTLSGAAGEDAVVSGNSDLWTQDAGYNQDLGIFVSVNGGTATLVAWKESGGFAGTFSPNAAYVQTVYPMTAGDTYVFSLEWKTNIPASGATIEAGAGSFPSFSPTRLTAYEVAAASVVTAVSTQQYLLPNSDGSTWSPMDSTNLSTSVTGSAETVLVSGNADLWTANGGYNQDLGIFVSKDGGTATLLAWTESGGFAGTYSPCAAYVQTVYTMSSGHTYVFSLGWKTNIPALGATIEAAAGGGPTVFSPTRLTVVPRS